jgi:lactate dehydrogenase-like 2-hydroxyacid dehydrogenase
MPSTAKKPRILVTRKLPAPVEARLVRDFDAVLNKEDKLYGPEELIAAAAGCDGLLPCPTEKLTADVVARLPESIRIVATFSVGFEHIDIAACKARGIRIVVPSAEDLAAKRREMIGHQDHVAMLSRISPEMVETVSAEVTAAG